MALRLIINADDYGRSPDISRGIRDAHLHGMVTSTSCMMIMPSVVANIKIALQETPNLGLGVHLVLTSGKPLLPASQISTFTKAGGEFLNITELVKRLPNLDPDEAKAEWHAQVEAFIAAAEKKPTHIDAHHHVSYFTPNLLQAFLELAREYDIAVRLPIAYKMEAGAFGLPAKLVEQILDFGPRILEEFQPRSPDAFFASFYDKNATRGEFLRILSHFLPNGTFEIMCHPGYVDEAFARESAYAYQRMNEFEILTDPTMRNEVEKRGIQLISFAQL
ncbi:MAG: ChbG/HpnK family deacetylase [Chloroflexi bacterium]|nr:ChbG/HpnK family deacetylase [Chloroflexota bacterium]